MRQPIRAVYVVLAAALWINFSEFFRNELLFKHYWVGHYQSLGLVFPSQPANGAVWGLWGLLCALGVYVVSRRFSLIETTLLCWLIVFVLMWVAIGNMGVLPAGLLMYAVPLSLLEVFLAAYICQRLRPRRR